MINFFADAVSWGGLGTVVLSLISAGIGSSIAGWISFKVAKTSIEAQHKAEYARRRRDALERIGTAFIIFHESDLERQICLAKLYSESLKQEEKVVINERLAKLPDPLEDWLKFRSIQGLAKIFGMPQLYDAIERYIPARSALQRVLNEQMLSPSIKGARKNADEVMQLISKLVEQG